MYSIIVIGALVSFFFQAEDGIRDIGVTGVQTCALPISEVLAYSAIGQVGYVLVALGIGGAVGLSAALIYAVVNSLNKALLFLVAGLRGPLVGGAFAVGAFSLMGVPPAVGFIGKIAVFKAGLAASGVVQVAVLVALIFLGSALSFVYALQIYQRAFLSKEPQGGYWEKSSP